MRVRMIWSAAGALCMLLFLQVDVTHASILTKVTSIQMFEVLSMTGTGSIGGPSALTITADIDDDPLIGGGAGSDTSGGGLSMASFDIIATGVTGDIEAPGGASLMTGSKIVTEVVAWAEGVSPDEFADAFIAMNIRFAFEEGLGVPMAEAVIKYTSEYTIEIIGSDPSNGGFADATGSLEDAFPDSLPSPIDESLFGSEDSSLGDVLVTDMVMSEHTLAFASADDNRILLFDNTAQAFASDGTNAVPEPSTMVVWSMIGIGAVGGYRMRQKRKEKKAA